MSVLYTIGYGNSAPDEFLARLKEVRITTVLDVRRKESKSWCGAYRWGSAMKNLLKTDGIKYYMEDAFGNEFDTLAAYQEWLTNDEEIGYRVTGLSREIAQNDADVACLLCSEMEVYEAPQPGKGLVHTVDCHRVYVAEALVESLGAEWSVKHL